MDPIDTPAEERFEEYLRGESARPANDRLRGLVFERTARALRRRRLVRRAGAGLLLLGLYVAGAATGWLALGVRGGVPPAAQLAQGTPGTGDVPASAADSTGAALAQETEPAAALDEVVPGRLLEHWADAVPLERRAAMYRCAGDRYLELEADLQSALRCYARSLATASDADLEISQDHDSWLLIALKQARQKETKHGDNEG